MVINEMNYVLCLDGFCRNQWRDYNVYIFGLFLNCILCLN